LHKPDKEEAFMQARRGDLWRHPDFLKFWAAESISLIGSQVTTFALPLIAALTLNATPAQVGILNAAAFAPFLLLVLPAGVWIDRQRRRPLMIATNLGRAILLGLIPVLAVTGRLRMEYLYAIMFLSGSCNVVFQLAYQAYLPALVDRDQITEGNSKLAATTSIAEIGGPGIGSLMVALFSPSFALILDAASFLIGATVLGFIRKPEHPPARPEHKQALRSEISDGFRLTFGHPCLRAFAGEAATYNLFWTMMQTVFVLYVVRELRLPQEIYGMILIAGSSGALVGALVTNQIAQRLGIGATIVATAILADVAPLLIPLAGGPNVIRIGILMLSFFFQGIGMTGCNVHIVSLRQVITPDQLRGRMNASYRLLVSGMLPIGALLGGFLGEAIGIRATLFVGALGLLSTWLWIWFSPVPKLHSQPESLDDLAAAIAAEPTSMAMRS
jgi:MFS family permease